MSGRVVHQLNPEAKERWMRHALNLASKGLGHTSPNPVVGAVIVKNGRMIAEGYHRRAGKAHAEIEALRKAGKKAQGAKLFVTLEPCCHVGKTPPCADALIESGIGSVIVGMRDPNPLVSGKGIRRLKSAGIQVETGVLKKECLRLNEAFIKFITTRRPFVISKAAISLDGKIATAEGESQWITGSQARKHVHEVRSQVDSILVGAGTVVADNPRLTARLGAKKVRLPARIIVDPDRRVSVRARVFHNADEQKVVYATSHETLSRREQQLQSKGVIIRQLKRNKKGLDLAQLMACLGEMEMTSVLIEGGSEINFQAFQSGIVDKVMWFMAPRIIGGREAKGAVGGAGVKALKDAWQIQRMEVHPIGNDFLVEGYLK